MMRGLFGTFERICGALVGVALAAWPAVLAAAEGGRTLERPEDALPVALLTGAAVLGVFAVAAIGFLYRRRRGLDWEFQRPDAPQDHH
jgi:hypothetical protein